jgi:hypothetical protein
LTGWPGRRMPGRSIREGVPVASTQHDPAAMQQAFNAFAALLGTEEGRAQVRDGTWQEALVGAGADPSAILPALVVTIAGFDDAKMALIAELQGELSEPFPGIELCIIF